ncbi:conserved Plasmodium protein, unknown function [Plasmodium malariae]|uniref:Uncharacterized protein n=1 Tax=Plasmodium malariae TaxID=5858 RepID=A0A1C3L251_PLAMA|nr:conserved Plasmodium protein, unknown function [Plasmodium malariae]SBT80631.1 conserved Plasmodium protein, unknown function [Plasmodium malariae]SCP03215.1 conserved Plasmodium protein, unknown function [Plasmodium malariae]
MKKYQIILYFIVFISSHFLTVNTIRKKGLKGTNENNEHVQKEKNLGNFEIMKDKNNVSNIELKSSTFFNILASTRLMQSVGQPISHSPVYRYIHNIHDHNENNGAVLVFVLFVILIFSVLFFIFYFIFRHHVKHVEFMNTRR